MQARKIESATIVFCVFQLLLLVLGGAGYAMLAYRVNHFDYGKLQIDEEKILNAVQLATKEFLHNYQTNVESKVEVKKPSIDVKECNGIIYGTFRNQYARIGNADYGVGDFIKDGTNLFEVAILDFDRQRLYALSENGDKLILCMVGLPFDKSKDGFPADRKPDRTRASEGERDDERRKGSPFS